MKLGILIFFIVILNAVYANDNSMRFIIYSKGSTVKISKKFLNTAKRTINIKREYITEQEDDLCYISFVYPKIELQKLIYLSKPISIFPEDESSILLDSSEKLKNCNVNDTKYKDITEERISYINNNIFVLEQNNYSYFGKLHEYFATFFYNIDRHTGKIILWSDIFNNKKVLYDYIIREMESIIDDGVKRTNDEIYNMATSADHIELNDSGIHIHFRLYEISGYANGEPSFLIPIEILKKHLSKEKYNYYFTKRLKNNN